MTQQQPGTNLAIIPNDLQLPDYLRTPDAAEAIAKANAAAAGGIKVGGFPRISIKGGKFHFVDGDTTTTLMDPPSAPGAPATPKMLLRVVIASANPAVSKLYYAGEWGEGDSSEPDCSSDNGVTPDAHIANPQNDKCATCPQNQWGSKISKATQKEVKACSDIKNLAVIPAEDLGFKAACLTVTPAALKEWGNYVKALTNRNVPVNAVITNVMFDATASFPKLTFSFGGVLTAEQYAKVQQRAQGDDVKAIVQPSRTIVPLLPAPAQPAGAQALAPKAESTPATPTASAGVLPVPPAAPVTGFGAPAAPPPADTPRRTRAPRKPPEAAQKAAEQAAATAAAQVEQVVANITQAVQKTAKDAPLAHLPAEVRATVNLLGADSELGKALIAKYPVPASVAPVTSAAPVGFGASTPGTASSVQAVSTSTQATANDLAAKLKARLAQGQPKPAGA